MYVGANFAAFTVKDKGTPKWAYVFFSAITVNAFSLVILCHTLVQIADLQIRHEQQDLDATFSERPSIMTESRKHLTDEDDDRLDVDTMLIEESAIVRHTMPPMSRSQHF